MSGLSDADCETLAVALHPFGIRADTKGATNVARVCAAVEQIVARHVAAALNAKADEIESGPHGNPTTAAVLDRAAAIVRT